MSVSSKNTENRERQEVASSVKGELVQLGNDLTVLETRLFLFADAAACVLIEHLIKRFGEEKWHGVDFVNPTHTSITETLDYLAQEVGSYGTQLFEQGDRLSSEERVTTETARSVAASLENISGLMMGDEQLVGVSRKALQYRFARDSFKRAENHQEDEDPLTKVYGKDLLMDMESSPIVKQLHSAENELFGIWGWLEELAKRLREAFPKEE